MENNVYFQAYLSNWQIERSSKTEKTVKDR